MKIRIVVIGFALCVCLCGCQRFLLQNSHSDRIHIQARSGRLVGAFAWRLEMFYSAARERALYQSEFLDTLIVDKIVAKKIVNDMQMLKKDTVSYQGINIKVLCRITYPRKEYLLIALDPHRSVYVKYMKRNTFNETDGQMYQWNEAFYENIKKYIPYEYP